MKETYFRGGTLEEQISQDRHTFSRNRYQIYYKPFDNGSWGSHANFESFVAAQKFLNSISVLGHFLLVDLMSGEEWEFEATRTLTEK